MHPPNPLNPAQREVLDQLGATPDERPRFDAALRHQLRRALDDGTESLRDQVDPGDTLFVNKHLLSTVMGCERRFLAEDDEPRTASAALGALPGTPCPTPAASASRRRLSPCQP